MWTYIETTTTYRKPCRKKPIYSYVKRNERLKLEYIKRAIKHERRNNTFHNPEDVTCNWKKCAAGMGIVGNGKCFLKGTGKEGCKQFLDEETALKKLEVSK